MLNKGLSEFIKKILFVCGICAFLVCAVCAYAADVQNDLENGIVRLHIIAQSDSDYDQAVKLEVRDAVLEAAEKEGVCDGESLAKIAEKAANAKLDELGYEHNAAAEYGLFEFPEKSYRGITLPAGEYNGVRVVIGDGQGKNWWCVMLPPLCVCDGEPELDEEGQSVLRNRLRNDTYELVTDNEGDTVVKLRIVEAAREIIGAVNKNGAE